MRQPAGCGVVLRLCSAAIAAATAAPVGGKPSVECGRAMAVISEAAAAGDPFYGSFWLHIWHEHLDPTAARKAAALPLACPKAPSERGPKDSNNTMWAEARQREQEFADNVSTDGGSCGTMSFGARIKTDDESGTNPMRIQRRNLQRLPGRPRSGNVTDYSKHRVNIEAVNTTNQRPAFVADEINATYICQTELDHVHMLSKKVECFCDDHLEVHCVDIVVALSVDVHILLMGAASLSLMLGWFILFVWQRLPATKGTQDFFVLEGADVIMDVVAYGLNYAGGSLAYSNDGGLIDMWMRISVYVSVLLFVIEAIFATWIELYDPEGFPRLLPPLQLFHIVFEDCFQGIIYIVVSIMQIGAGAATPIATIYMGVGVLQAGIFLGVKLRDFSETPTDPNRSILYDYCSPRKARESDQHISRIRRISDLKQSLLDERSHLTKEKKRLEEEKKRLEEELQAVDDRLEATDLSPEALSPSIGGGHSNCHTGVKTNRLYSFLLCGQFRAPDGDRYVLTMSVDDTTPVREMEEAFKLWLQANGKSDDGSGGKIKNIPAVLEDIDAALKIENIPAVLEDIDATLSMPRTAKAAKPPPHIRGLRIDVNPEAGDML
eukprot:COSAG02_NODE_398_length_23118_cov_49.968939_26_plen_606_part_00